MKIYLKPCRTLLLICLLGMNKSYATGRHLKGSGIDSILVTHQWTLIEIMQTFRDTVTNMTLLMMPCEKDNYLVYRDDHTYQILEGTVKCNNTDPNIKVEGIWEYDPDDTSLIERYGSGSKIAKKILFISDEILKIQYVGEGRKTFVLTYFSEKGKANDNNKELAVDNSDPSQNITNVIREYLLSTGHYTLIGKKELEAGQSLKEQKDMASPLVAVIPFMNEPPGEKVIERNNLLIAQAKKAGADYVITGCLDDARTLKNNNNIEGLVKFRVDVLDIAADRQSAKIFTNEKTRETAHKKNNGFNLLNSLKEIIQVIPLLFGVQLLRLDNLYSYYFLNSLVSASAQTYEASNVFSQVSEEQRKRNYDSTTALVKAVGETSLEVEEFVAGNAALKIRINRVEGTGNRTKVVIEAGSNIHLKENEILSVVRLKNTEVAGKTVVEKEEFGEIQVDQVVADVLSYCSAKDRKNKIEEGFRKFPGEVFVLTVIQPVKKH